MPRSSPRSPRISFRNARARSRKSSGAASSQLMDFNIGNPLKRYAMKIRPPGDDQANVTQAVPLLDVVGRRLRGDDGLVDVDIEHIRHDVPDSPQNDLSAHATSLTLRVHCSKKVLTIVFAHPSKGLARAFHRKTSDTQTSGDQVLYCLHRVGI